MKTTSKKSTKKAKQVGEIINSVPQASAEQVQPTAPTAKQGEAPVRAKSSLITILFLYPQAVFCKNRL